MTAQPPSHLQTENRDFGFGFNDGTLKFMPEVDVKSVPPSSENDVQEEETRVSCAPDHPDLFLANVPTDLFDWAMSTGDQSTAQSHVIQ